MSDGLLPPVFLPQFSWSPALRACQVFELLLMTLISAGASGGQVIESQSIETYSTAAECLEASRRFIDRKIQLPTGQTLTLKLSCEKKP